MKKQLLLGIELYKNGTVMIESDSYNDETHQVGTIEFMGTIDGRRKTFNPMEMMERAGLVTAKHDENMFSNYKATDKLYKAFKSEGIVLCFADTENVRKRLNSLMNETGATQKQAISNLKNAGVTKMADIYQLSDTELRKIIIK